jgi:hypothetical protein
MPRNRINYPVQALYVGPTPSTGNQFAGGVLNSGATKVSQLYRVQSCNYSWNVPLTDVQQMGETAAVDRVQLSSPNVSLDFNYVLSSLYNESGLGFNTDGTVSCLSGILTQVSDDKNYWLKINPEGVDANGSTINSQNIIVIGVGNGFVSSYSSQASVGGLPQNSVSVQGLNMAWTTGISGIIPAVDPSVGTRMSNVMFVLPNATGSPGTGNLGISVLRPGDISLSFTKTDGSAYDGVGADINDAKIQSYNLSFDLNREVIEKLGSRYAYTRQPQFPVTVNLSVDAIVGDITTGDLSSYIACDKNYNVQIDIRKPDCTLVGNARPVLVRYQVKNAKLASQNYSSAINGNKTVTLNFESQIGGIQQTDRGIFLSGVLTP